VARRIPRPLIVEPETHSDGARRQSGRGVRPALGRIPPPPPGPGRARGRARPCLPRAGIRAAGARKVRPFKRRDEIWPSTGVTSPSRRQVKSRRASSFFRLPKRAVVTVDPQNRAVRAMERMLGRVSSISRVRSCQTPGRVFQASQGRLRRIVHCGYLGKLLLANLGQLPRPAPREVRRGGGSRRGIGEARVRVGQRFGEPSTRRGMAFSGRPLRKIRRGAIDPTGGAPLACRSTFGPIGRCPSPCAAAPIQIERRRIVDSGPGFPGRTLQGCG